MARKPTTQPETAAALPEKKASAEQIAARIADEKIPDIYNLIERGNSLAAARAMYAEVFGRSHDDKNIDREIEERFVEWLGEPIPLRVPPRLVLALMLRKGFAGRGRGQRPNIYQLLAGERWLREFRELRDVLRAEFEGKPLIGAGKKLTRHKHQKFIDKLTAEWRARKAELGWVKGEAQDQAAQRISELSGISVNTLVDGRVHRRRPRGR